MNTVFSFSFCFENFTKSSSEISTEGPEGVKWELGLASFALGKWGSSHTGTGKKMLKIKNGNGIWELQSGIWKKKWTGKWDWYPSPFRTLPAALPMAAKAAAFLSVAKAGFAKASKGKISPICLLLLLSPLFPRLERAIKRCPFLSLLQAFRVERKRRFQDLVKRLLHTGTREVRPMRTWTAPRWSEDTCTLCFSTF